MLPLRITFTLISLRYVTNLLIFVAHSYSQHLFPFIRNINLIQQTKFSVPPTSNIYAYNPTTSYH